MKNINEQINPRILSQAKRLSAFTSVVQSCMPVAYHAHVKVANIKHNSLILLTNSPVWTTRIRQLSSTILDTLMKNADKLPKTQKIHHIQVQTGFFSPSDNNESSGNSQIDSNTINETQGQYGQKRRKAVNQPRLSIEASQYLFQSANNIEDEQLKQSLARLAKNLHPVK